MMMSDRELIEIAKRYGKPIVYIPIDTIAEQQVATVNLLNPRRPIVTRQRVEQK